MSQLSHLKLVAVKKPRNMPQIVIRRNKLSSRLWEQIQLAKSQLDGKPFVSYIYEALQPIVGENCIIVSSNPDYDFLGCTRVEDIIPNKGPLGGIYTGLKYSKTKMNQNYIFINSMKIIEI